MADNIRIKIEGLADLERRLAAMGQEVAAKNLVSTAFAANKQVVDAIKARITANQSVETGLLRDSIKRKKIVYGNSGTVVIVTGVDKAVKGVDSKGKPRVPFRYAHIVEKRNPFMVPAFDSVKQAVIDEFVAKLTRKIKKFEKGAKQQ